MTGALIALLAVLWAVVLLPVALRAKENAVSVSVGTFSRSMRALSSNHEAPAMSGRWVLTPRTPLDEPDPALTIFRRRRIFCGLLAALAFSLPASLAPGLHFLIWVSGALAIALGGFTAFLVNEKKRRAYRPLGTAHPAGTYRHQQPTIRFDDRSTILRMPPSQPPVRVVRQGSSTMHFINDETLADDDGLSELGWAQAGRY